MFSLVSVEEKKPAPKVSEPPPQPKEEEPRYGLSAMKIDSKSLLSMKRQSVSSAVKRTSSVAQVRARALVFNLHGNISIL